MKTPFHLLFALAAVLCLAACGKAGDPAPAPQGIAATPAATLLGGWQSDTLRQVSYDVSGRVKFDEVHLLRSRFDFAAAAVTFSASGQSQAWAYALSGDVLTLTGPSTPPEQSWARRVRPGYFIFEAYSRAGIPVGSAGAVRQYYYCHR